MTTVARRSLLTVVSLIVIAVATGAAWYSGYLAENNIREQLKNRSATVAELLDQDDIKQLTGKNSDLDADYYQRTKRTLANLKETNPDIRSLYVTERRGDKLYFYVDSEDSRSRYYSPPGQYYPEASPLFKNIFDTGKAAVEGPSKDSFGSWVSGLAPIHDTNNGQVIGVLGMDIDSAYYYRTVTQAVSMPVLLGLLVLAFLLANEFARTRQERLMKMQSELVSIASHDLRSPLAGVRWATESLIPHLDEANKIMARRILASATNLQASIDSLLQISRVASPDSPRLELADHNLTDLVQQVCDSQQLAAEQKGVNLHMDGSWSKPITIHCDAERLKRALQNVVSNAVKYTKDNTDVYINYHFNGDAHQIRVSDQGIGIPDNEKQKIFQGFYRASNAQASKVQGSGLGLYLTRSVIQQHGGKVTIDSKQDVGTTVTLTLPR